MRLRMSPASRARARKVFGLGRFLVPPTNFAPPSLLPAVVRGQSANSLRRCPSRQFAQFEPFGGGDSCVLACACSSFRRKLMSIGIFGASGNARASLCLEPFLVFILVTCLPLLKFPSKLSF